MSDTARKTAAVLSVLLLVSGVTGYVYLQRASPEAFDVLSPNPGSATSAEQSEQSRHTSPFRFEGMTPQSGIDFVYYGAPGPQAYMTQQNGGGVGLLDIDNDGRLDLFLVNGSDFDRPATGLKTSNRLYRSTADFQYEDATGNTGLMAHGFGMGCAAADYDNDGFTDLFVACYGRNRLWHNNGDGTFTETTMAAGVHNAKWGTSAAFADLDGDGFSDLYVVNYVDWSSDEPSCHPPGHPEINSVCSPMDRSGQADLLYHNTRNGQFVEIGADAGVALVADGKGLALTVADLDVDGRLDIYVVNDTSPNYLFRNTGGMKFEEVGVRQGVAISSDGRVGSGMGVACADYDHNGYLDLCVTNFRNQINDVYACLGPAGFVPANSGLGMDLISRSPLGFGIVLADFDLDTWPDLFVANGHFRDWTHLGPEHEYQMHPQLLWNRRGQRFEDVSRSSGNYFAQRWLGRAAAVADMDNDGDADLVVTHLSATPALLRNDTRPAGGSIRLELIGTRSSRQSLGSRVEIVTDSGRLVTSVPSGGSFQASHDRRILLATGSAESIDEIRVWWSGGSVEVWKNVAADDDGGLRLIEGSGSSGLVR